MVFRCDLFAAIVIIIIVLLVFVRFDSIVWNILCICRFFFIGQTIYPYVIKLFEFIDTKFTERYWLYRIDCAIYLMYCRRSSFPWIPIAYHYGLSLLTQRKIHRSRSLIVKLRNATQIQSISLNGLISCSFPEMKDKLGECMWIYFSGFIIILFIKSISIRVLINKHT